MINHLRRLFHNIILQIMLALLKIIIKQSWARRSFQTLSYDSSFHSIFRHHVSSLSVLYIFNFFHFLIILY